MGRFLGRYLNKKQPVRFTEQKDRFPDPPERFPSGPEGPEGRFPAASGVDWALGVAQDAYVERCCCTYEDLTLGDPPEKGTRGMPDDPFTKGFSIVQRFRPELEQTEQTLIDQNKRPEERYRLLDEEAKRRADQLSCSQLTGPGGPTR